MMRTNNQVSMNEMMIDVQPPVLPPIPEIEQNDSALEILEPLTPKKEWSIDLTDADQVKQFSRDLGIDYEELRQFIVQLIKKHNLVFKEEEGLCKNELSTHNEEGCRTF